MALDLNFLKNFYKITLQKYWKFLFNCCNMIAEKYLHKQK